MRADTMAAETHGLVWPSVPVAGDSVTGPAVPATGRVEPVFDSSVLSTQLNTPERDESCGTGSSVGEQSCCHRETQVWDGLEDTNRRCDWQ